MNNFSEQFKNATKDIRLSADEKRDMRAALSRAMGTPSLVRVVKSPYVFLSYAWMRALAVLVLAVFVGGGTAFAAQGALPGSALYAFKTNVIEPVEVALAPTPSQKAEVHAEIAQRRIEEGEALAKMGTLDATTTEALADNFDEHSQAALAYADEASGDDPSIKVAIGARLRASSSAGGAVLAALGRGGDEHVREHSDALATRVLARADSNSGHDAADAEVRAFAAPAPQATAKVMSFSATSVSDASSSAETAVNPEQEETAARLEEKASKVLLDARAQLKLATDLDASTTVSIGNTLTGIDALMSDGAKALGDSMFDTAVRDFTEAYARAVKLEVLLKAQHSLDGKLVEPLLHDDGDSGDSNEGEGR